MHFVQLYSGFKCTKCYVAQIVCFSTLKKVTVLICSFPFFKMNAAFYRKYKLRGNFAVQFVSCEHLPHYTLPLALKFNILFEMEVG